MVVLKTSDWTVFLSQMGINGTFENTCFPQTGILDHVDRLYFQQDKVPSHYKGCVCDALDDKFQRILIGRSSSVALDLTPCDFLGRYQKLSLL